MSQIKKIIKDGTSYGVGIMLAQAIGVFTSIAMRRFLTPEMMGIWTALMLMLEYSLFTELGIFNAAVVRIPYLRGKNLNAEIQSVRNVIFTFAVVLSLIVAFILFAASTIAASRFPPYIILGIRIMIIIVVATFFYNLYIVMLRADKNFTLLSKATVVNSLAMLIFVSALTYLFKLNGIYFATLFATAISIVYIKFNSKYRFRMYFNLQLFRSLSKVGLPIFITGITYMVLLSVDKIMIINMLGPKELGFYSIAILALTYAYNIPKIFGIVLFPTMQEEFGKSDSKERALTYVKKPIFVMAYLFPAVLVLAYFGIPLLVNYVLPKYMLGINSMRMLLCGCFFISLAPFAQNFVVTINKQTVMIFITAAAAIFGIAMNYGAIKMGYGIIGVALATSITYFLYFMLMYFYVLLHCEKWPFVLRSFFSLLVPFIYSLAIIVSLEYLIRTDCLVANIIGQMGVFYLAYTPLLWYLNKKTDLISKVIRRDRVVGPKGGINEAYYTDTVL